MKKSKTNKAKISCFQCVTICLCLVGIRVTIWLCFIGIGCFYVRPYGVTEGKFNNSCHYVEDFFVNQRLKSNFMDTLEDALTSQRTSPVVLERLLAVLLAVAYASPATSLKNASSFRILWRKVKPHGKPDEVSLSPCVKLYPFQD